MTTATAQHPITQAIEAAIRAHHVRANAATEEHLRSADMWSAYAADCASEASDAREPVG